MTNGQGGEVQVIEVRLKKYSLTGRLWRWFASVFTVLALAVLALDFIGVPIIDRNSATVMTASLRAQVATGKALAIAIGEPAAELNTADVRRFLFKDGTSVDVLPHQTTFPTMCELRGLKSIVLNLFSLQSPAKIAKKISDSLESDNFRTQVITQPDSAFPSGSVVLLLSDAFRHDDGTCFAVIVRKHTFRVGGQAATWFTKWPAVVK